MPIIATVADFIRECGVSVVVRSQALFEAGATDLTVYLVHVRT